MLNILNSVDLLKYNTFGLSQTADFFTIIDTEEACLEIERSLPHDLPVLPLGGGSNMLLTEDVHALVLKNEIKGISKIKEDADYIWLAVGAGEVWNDFVQYAVAHNYGGVENLSLIPGTVGAAPMQNIGAYGAEVKQVIESVRFWDFEMKQFREFENAACRFDYRNSIFKNELKGKVFITKVVFKLSKNPVYNISYGNIQQQLEADQAAVLSLRAVSDAVIHIRQSKLPNPAKIGNAGSFFKNPEISTETYHNLKATYPDMPGYPKSNLMTKVPAAWLIENCGWKGYRKDNFGVHTKQPLVLVNYGGAMGKDIFILSEEIIESVHQKFGILLEREVQIL